MICLVTGGARSGKSAYAEKRILDSGIRPRIYIATMDPGDDAENRERIRKHREDRAGKDFQTIECPVGLASVRVPKGSAVLLDCLTNLLANEMFGEAGAQDEAAGEILRGIGQLSAEAAELYIVANRIDGDGADYHSTVERYRDEHSFLLCRIAELADEVIELVCGIPLPVKPQRKGEEGAP